MVDISGTIWEKDIPGKVKAMKDAGISEFTISDTSCGIVRTLAVFEENGAKLQGVDQSQKRLAQFRDWRGRDEARIPHEDSIGGHRFRRGDFPLIFFC